MSDKPQHSPGPWRACQADDGKCKCGQIWSIPRDIPIASARQRDIPEEGMPEVPESEFHANAALIASAPETKERHDRMAAMLRELEWSGTDAPGYGADIRDGVCPLCKESPHEPDCKLSKLLQELP